MSDGALHVKFGARCLLAAGSAEALPKAPEPATHVCSQAVTLPKQHISGVPGRDTRKVQNSQEEQSEFQALGCKTQHWLCRCSRLAFKDGCPVGLIFASTSTLGVTSSAYQAPSGDSLQRRFNAAVNQQALLAVQCQEIASRVVLKDPLQPIGSLELRAPTSLSKCPSRKLDVAGDKSNIRWHSLGIAY